MKTLKKKRRVQIIAIAAVALIAATALIGYGMRDGINFFRAPSQVVADPPAASEVFRIGGLVDLFAEKQGMVGTGSLRDGVFVASEILAKHDEDYMPKEVVDALKEQGVYQDPKDG